jgi:GNAT superfamily N-acetyltransferase
MNDAIRLAVLPRDLRAVRALFEEYAASLGIDLGFQQFDEELACLSGQYSPPRGRLILAWHGSAPAGCIALRPLSDGDCEMKRLYIRPAYRRFGLGRRLIERLIECAQYAGYQRVLLDTLPYMSEAQRLYQRFGFQEIEAYYFNPVPGAKYFALRLFMPNLSLHQTAHRYAARGR